MTLMKLAPESVRLRRMAKAYSAGEITEAEYRQARRDVIDNFCTEAPAEDDTRRRWCAADEETGPDARADATLPRAQQPAGGAGALHPAPAAGDPGRRWLWLAAVALALAAALLALPRAWADAGWDVPPVSERDPDPARSPRLDVREVTVAWGGDEPGTVPGLDLAVLQSRAQAALQQVRERQRPGPHGFTAAELEEVGRLLNVLGVHEPGAELDAADAADLAALVRDQKRRRGISVAELEQVAGEVQQELRDRGYFLGAVYLPAQRLVDGTVRLAVLPGRLGQVVVNGGDPRLAQVSFGTLQGRPLTLAEVSSRLQALNALPGVNAQASFAPGAAVGQTRLLLDVVEHRGWGASVSLDNHGVERFGEQRLGVTGSWLSPRGIGDRLTAGGLFALDPTGQTYLFAGYDTPAPGGFRLAASLGNNDFSADGAAELDGRGLYLDLAARRSLLQSRARGLTLVLSGARQALTWDDGSDQVVSLLGVGLAGHRTWDQARVAGDLAVRLSGGHLGGDRFAGESERFSLVELDAQAWLPLNVPGLPGEQTLKARLEGQWSPQRLPAPQRFTLGGAHRARAFDPEAFLGDRAALLGMELRTPLAAGELVGFVEAGYGRASAAGDDPWTALGDLGLGWEAELLPGLSSRLIWAVPVLARGTGDVDDDGHALYWSLRYGR